MSLPVAHDVARAGAWQGRLGSVTLDHDGRMLRRKRLVADDGRAFLVDLAQTLSLDAGDAFVLAEGHIEVIAAPEPLLAVRGDLVRLAWHIGNRHTPCQIAADHLLIRDDKVLAGMLRGLGGTVTPVLAPFQPEGGAYGHGRTMGHSHGPYDHHDHHDHHDHDHSAHGHSHE